MTKSKTIEQKPLFDKVVCLIGDRGSCKTLFAVSLAHYYDQHDIKVFTNIKLKGIKYIPVTFKEIADFPNWLHDGVIIMDEMQIGADSYKFLGKTAQGITSFITQIRKANLTFMYTTQNFTMIAKRLRQQTNYSYQFLKYGIGQSKIDVYDNMNFYKHLKTIYFDGRKFFDNYDTNQIITE